MDQKLDWILTHFNDLTVFQLYDLLRLRSEIFVVEQNCIFLDPDNVDPQCHHFLGYKLGKLVAYSRIVPANITYEFPSIGRIVVAGLERKNKYGVELVHKSIQCVEKLYGNADIQIGAQLYLKKFYESFYFFQLGEVYMEDGIKHIKMVRKGL